MQEAEFRLPARQQTNIYINKIKTEAQAAEYISKVTARLHPKATRRGHVRHRGDRASVSALRKAKTKIKSRKKPKNRGGAGRKKNGRAYRLAQAETGFRRLISRLSQETSPGAIHQPRESDHKGHRRRRDALDSSDGSPAASADALLPRRPRYRPTSDVKVSMSKRAAGVSVLRQSAVAPRNWSPIIRCTLRSAVSRRRTVSDSAPAFVTHYTPNESWRLSWNLDAVGASSGAWRAGGYMKIIHTPVQKIIVNTNPTATPAKSNIKIHPYTVFNIYARQPRCQSCFFFGLGPNTSESGKSIFGMRETIIGGNAICASHQRARDSQLERFLVGRGQRPICGSPREPRTIESID